MDQATLDAIRAAGQFVLVDEDGSPLMWNFEYAQVAIFATPGRKVLQPTNNEEGK